MTLTLSKEEQEKFCNQVNAIQNALLEFLKFAKTNLQSYNGLTIESYDQHFLQIFARFRLNTEGLICLLDNFKEDYRLKISLNLLLRSICSDILTALYLLTFYDKSDTEKVALNNELNVISAEFLKSIIPTIEEEHEILEYFGVDQNISLDKKKEFFNLKAKNLFDDFGKIKTKKKIRQTTSQLLKEGLNDNGFFLTESEKYKRIKEKIGKDFGYIFIAFKYYSQFQHFNLYVGNLTNNKPFMDLFFMFNTIDNMLLTTEQIMTIVISPNLNFHHDLADIQKKLIDEFRLT
ncbi:MAG: hypothetical protein J0I09_10615 [Sphingobacteriia bacterium]|nr:hypothetical protein [Sphingobacteriia bacterium]